MPIWYCIVQYLQVANGQTVYSLIKAIKTDLNRPEEIRRCYQEFLNLHESMPMLTAMLFKRDPEESMFTKFGANDPYCVTPDFGGAQAV